MRQPDPESGLPLSEFDKEDHINGTLTTNLDATEDDIEQQPATLSLLEQPSLTIPPIRPNSNVAYLDGLRGFAAVLVYISHHESWFYGAEAPLQHGWGWHDERVFGNLPFIRPFFCGGSAAVAIFFVLSGYVLSRSPLRALSEGQVGKCYDGLIGSVIRRPFRLFIPPAGTALVLALIMQLPFGLAPKLTWPEAEPNVIKELGRLVWELVLVFNPFITRTISTRWFPYNPPAWTMPVEFQGSMVVFFGVFLASKVQPRFRMALFGINGVVLMGIGQWAMSCFCFGVVLSINDLEELDERKVLYRLSARTRSIVFHTMLLIAWYLFGQVAGAGNNAENSYNSWGWYYLTMIIPNNYYHGEYWRWYNAIGGIMTVYATTKLPWIQRMLMTPAMRYIGKVSFSLYLIHIPFLWVAGDKIYRIFGMCRLELQTWADNLLRIPEFGPMGLTSRFVVAQMVMFPICLLLAELGTHIFDKPSITIGKRVVERFRRG